MSEGLLSQFSLAKEQSDWIGGKENGIGNEVEVEDEDEDKDKKAPERDRENNSIMQCALITKREYGRRISEKASAKVFHHGRSVRWYQ